MANETFVDTSGFYSPLVHRDRMYAATDYMARTALLASRTALPKFRPLR